MSASLSMITATNNTVNFLKNVGALYDAFSIHERRKEYKRCTLEEAHCAISNCVTTLGINQQKIVNYIKEKLPKVFKWPKGNVAQKPIEPIKMIEWEVSGLMRLTKKYDFEQTDQQSCMTLDVEHFHATAHYKTPVMTMLQYCRIFGKLMKENVKKSSNWTAHYKSP